MNPRFLKQLEKGKMMLMLKESRSSRVFLFVTTYCAHERERVWIGLEIGMEIIRLNLDFYHSLFLCEMSGGGGDVRWWVGC